MTYSCFHNYDPQLSDYQSLQILAKEQCGCRAVSISEDIWMQNKLNPLIISALYNDNQNHFVAEILYVFYVK